MVTYPILPVEDFGRALISTGDLDPVYIALARVDWPEEQRKRWLVAYWLFYHPGAACFMSETQPHSASPGSDFWAWAAIAAKNETPAPISKLDFPASIERWPRASERRHFRGDKSVKATLELARRFPGGHELVDFVAEAAPNYGALFNRVCSLPQFGPWMAFKVADMLERVMGVPVDFDLNSVTMFEDPKKAALMVARRNLGMSEETKFKDPDGVIRRVVEHLIAEFAGLSAPPAHDRPIGYQEVETVLCKWKSHVNGHYPVGKDCREIREGLEAWSGVSEAARDFLHWMPTGEPMEQAIPA
jgi:hypothetical protein